MSTFSRRQVLKCGAALLAGGAAGAWPPSSMDADAIGFGFERPRAPEKVVSVKGYCPFCQVRCTYNARVEDGVLASLVGDAGNRWTGGAMCPKGMSMVELVASPHRIVHPMLRTESGWKQITYAEAIDLIVARLRETMQKHGKEAGNRIALTSPLWDCRESELAALMTMRMAGSVHLMPAGEVCISSASNMLGLMLGINTSTTTVDEILNSETLVLWGANINDLYPPYTRWLDMARDKGVKIVYIDPRRTRTSLWSSMQLQPRPGTDGVLALGALRSIIESGSYDADYVAGLTGDFDLLKEDVASYTAGKVAELTGLKEEELTAFYAVLAGSRRTIVWLGGALSRYTNGIQSLRAIIALQGIRNNLIGSGKGMITMEGGKPAGEAEFIDHVCGPNTAPRMNFRRLRIAMGKGDIAVLFLNSSYRRYPDSKGVLAALGKVGFIVHRGFFMTEETELAHLFVPATFSPESQGSHYGAEKQVVWRDKIVDAPGECVPDWQFYRDIGRKLAPDKYPAFEKPEDLYRLFLDAVPSWKGMPLEKVRTSPDGMIWPRYSEDDRERTGTSFIEGKLLTEDGRMSMNDQVFGRIDWEPPKGSPLGKDKDPNFPLILTQGKVLHHWQQTLTNFSRGLAQFSNGRYVNIHPDTAARFGLKQGDQVLIETATGSVEAWVDIIDNIIPGIIFTPSHLTRSSPFPENRSEHINTILPNYWDRISSQTNGVGCTLKRRG
ncbi:MAG: molybdopterin-dependent oxidoreductase [Syntrophobacter sp.]